MKKAAKQVKILGQVVTVGSKEWERLTYQVKLFAQNGHY